MAPFVATVIVAVTLVLILTDKLDHTIILITSLSQQTSTPITARLWTRRGLPVAIATCVAGSILFVVFFPWLQR